MDELNKKILRELMKDSRQSYRKIAEKLNITTNTVINRVVEMEKKGIILSYTTIVDDEKVGYTIIAIIDISLTQPKISETYEVLEKNRNVYGIHEITGENDLIVLARFADRHDLNKFIKNTLKLPYVKRTNTHLILRTVKEDFKVAV